MKKYAPLFMVESYLIITLLILLFGPVNFRLHNEILFYGLIFLYHLSFIIGYIVLCITYKPIYYTDNKWGGAISFTATRFYLWLSMGIIGILLTYKNIMMSNSIIPYNIYSEVLRGVLEPGVVYAERMNSISSGFESSLITRCLNIISIFFLCYKLLFVFYFVFFWSALSFFKKIICVTYCFFFITPGVAAGTNSVIFQLVIFLGVSVIIISYLKRSAVFYLVCVLSFLMLFLAILAFGYIMSHRGGDFSYFSTTSPIGDVTIKMNTPPFDSFYGVIIYSLVWLNYYLVQGYYGFSLILDIDWSWTFGFGNSEFLQRQLMMLTGIDISEMTYQYKISNIWDKSAQWHSFYGQFANDFGLFGISILMVMLGYLFSSSWHSALLRKDFYGSALLPIFIIMFIFIPANNQVFAYIDTLSYFIVVCVLFCAQNTKLRNKNV